MYSMKVAVGVALAAAMLLGGCSGDDDDTALPTSTEEALATPTAQVTGPSQPEVSPALTAALAIEGSYSGEWANTTFDSSGPIALIIEVSAAAQFAIVEVDLGGQVFGGTDPAPVQFEIDLATEEWLGGGETLFGSTTLSTDAEGGFELSAPSVPGVGNIAMTMIATPSDAGFEGTYEISGLAVGTFTLTRS